MDSKPCCKKAKRKPRSSSQTARTDAVARADPAEGLRELIDDGTSERIRKRLAGEPHYHHKDCIHNLPADEQIALRGRTREWWEAMGLPEPVVIEASQWEESIDFDRFPDDS